MELGVTVQPIEVLWTALLAIGMVAQVALWWDLRRVERLPLPNGAVGVVVGIYHRQIVLHLAAKVSGLLVAIGVLLLPPTPTTLLQEWGGLLAGLGISGLLAFPGIAGWVLWWDRRRLARAAAAEEARHAGRSSADRHATGLDPS